MPLLMHISFDNSFRLKRRVYYFEYRGVRFKLIQNNPRRRADVLLTLVPSDDRAAREHAYAIAAEFLSALSWKNRSHVALQMAGGMGVPHGYSLHQAKCRVFTFPQVPFEGHHIGHGLSVIPDIENEAQRMALTLFREALSSNKVWLSFLFYWQIMEIGGGDPVKWINKVYYKGHKVFISPDDLQQIHLGGRRIGEYLQDDCRHAVAHIRRRSGKKSLRFDVGDENMRMNASTRVVQSCAECYICDVLGLSKKLHLVRRRGSRDFPMYVDSSTLRRYPYVLAYQ